MTAAEEWAEQLEAWRIPDQIMAQAPESPWGFPTRLFTAEQIPEGELHRIARQALAPAPGTVLDVGCGGGGASVPLAGSATHLVGVDSSAAMLDEYRRAAEQAGAEVSTVEGVWPDIAGETPRADVVVCRNVAYNVADIVPFIKALTSHADRLVVLELTAAHPSAALAPLWKAFWDLDRPDGPTAELFVRVLQEMGIAPRRTTESRPSLMARADHAEHVAFVRRRLCLPAERDPEVASALADTTERGDTTAVVVSWTATPAGSS
jgi:precorrin-6B methylase 2